MWKCSWKVALARIVTGRSSCELQSIWRSCSVEISFPSSEKLSRPVSPTPSTFHWNFRSKRWILIDLNVNYGFFIGDLSHNKLHDCWSVHKVFGSQRLLRRLPLRWTCKKRVQSNGLFVAHRWLRVNWVMWRSSDCSRSCTNKSNGVVWN